MAAIHELRDAFEERFAERLATSATTPEDALAWRTDRWVELLVETFRDLGRARGLEVAPLRRGVGEIGWELAWGKNLAVDYARLSATDPKDLFRLELVLEVSENSLRAATRAERAVEETAGDLGKLLWARSPLKVLCFGAQRPRDVASTLEALEAGLSGILSVRDRDSDWLLVALPNFQGAGTVAPGAAAVWTKVVAHGAAEPCRERSLAALLVPRG